LAKPNADVQFIEQRKDLSGHLVFAHLVRAFDRKPRVPALEHDHMMRASEGAVQIAHLPVIEVYRRAA
jgi:hypothetical protein